MPPSETPGVMLLNPPYGERIAAAGVAGRGRDNFQPGALADARSSHRAAEQSHHRETAQTDDGGDFFAQLASHWKKNYSGWSAWMLTPDLKLPSKMRLKESRRVPMWNGPIECRLFRFDMVKGSLKRSPTDALADKTGDAGTPAP
jgi:putative N6-adenine-specific DNA methylase